MSEHTSFKHTLPQRPPDPASALFSTIARQSDGPVLWLLDEQTVTIESSGIGRPTGGPIRFASNRYDIYCALHQAGADAVFNDFDFRSTENGQFQTILYRISKEKAVVHHLIKTAWRLLRSGGELVLYGAKNEGIKTYLDKAGSLFGRRADISKHGGFYLGRLSRSDAAAGTRLDDQDYAQLRVIGEQNDIPFLSKPGLFGWNKIDPGSALLAAQLPAVLANCKTPPQSLLDLGCGYGYLTLLAHQLQPFQRLVASDNNAAALLACQANFAARNITGEVIADDCGKSLITPFDLILCNPPFHRGFEHDQALTEHFLAAAARLLTASGRALFVVNRFIPLPRLAPIFFQHIIVVTENRSFIVFELAQAQPPARKTTRGRIQA